MDTEVSGKRYVTMCANIQYDIWNPVPVRGQGGGVPVEGYLGNSDLLSSNNVTLSCFIE
jgi:hypothetical protein